MNAALRVAPMTLGDLGLALDWAAAEGWNPGLDDATAFRAADPGGFLMGRIGAVPVAAISVVRHSEDFGFLGLYLCHPDWRGRGHGWALWQAGMAHLGARTIGLDGVPAQQANYTRRGFVAAGGNRRWSGRIEPRGDGAGLVPVTPEMLPDLLARDRAISGVARDAYLRAWLTDAPTRHTLVAFGAGRITGYGTIRACREGAKIGPLVAEDAANAEALLRGLAMLRPGERVSVDMPEDNPAAAALALRLGFAPEFETARMYKGPAPATAPATLYGLVSLELG